MVLVLFLDLMAVSKFTRWNTLDVGFSTSGSHASLLHDLIPPCLHVLSRPRLGSTDSTAETPTRLLLLRNQQEPGLLKQQPPLGFRPRVSRASKSLLKVVLRAA